MTHENFLAMLKGQKDDEKVMEEFDDYPLAGQSMALKVSQFPTQISTFSYHYFLSFSCLSKELCKDSVFIIIFIYID